MARYPRQDDKGGKNVIPSVTEIISDCTDGTPWAIPYGANQACDWIIGECEWDTLESQDEGYYKVTDEDLRKRLKGEKDYPNNARYAHKHHSQKALDIGSEVHNAIEVYLKREIARKDDGEPHWDITDPIYAKLSRQAMNAFNAFNAWQKEHNLKPIALEQTVYSHDGLWAGTLDLNCWLNEKRYIIDFKTSGAFYPEHRYQVAAYRIAVEDETLHEEDFPQGCGVLRLDKETGLPEWKDTSKSYKQDLRIFNRMVDLYFERHPIIRKRARG